MANNCDFHMKIRGRKDDCRELADLLAWKNGHEKDGIGRIYLCQVVDEGPGWLEVAGDCAWSVQTAILEPQGGRFAEELARLDLAVEVYSSEPGLQFQEHYVIDRGDVLVEEEVEYKEYWVEEMGREELAEVAEELGLTPDYLMENMNEWGDYRVGGFESWDFSYIPSPSRPSIEVLARDFARFAAADGARDVLRDYFPYGLEGMDESGIRSLLEGSLAKRSFEMDMGNAGSSSRGRNETAREEVRRLLLEGEDFYNVRDGRTVMPYISMPGYGDGEDGEGGNRNPRRGRLVRSHDEDGAARRSPRPRLRHRDALPGELPRPGDRGVRPPGLRGLLAIRRDGRRDRQRRRLVPRRPGACRRGVRGARWGKGRVQAFSRRRKVGRGRL